MYALAPATATRTRLTAPTLALAVLELLPRTRLTILLPLAGARIAGEQSGLLQRLPQLLVEARKGARQTVADGAGLARWPAALHRHQQGELPHRVRDGQRLRDDHAQRLAGEVVLERSLVDHDAAGARPDPHPRDGCLAPSGAVEAIEHSRHHRASAGVLRDVERVSTVGCCALCGCEAPRYTFSFLTMARPSRFFGSIPCTAHSMTRSG